MYIDFGGYVWKINIYLWSSPVIFVDELLNRIERSESIKKILIWEVGSAQVYHISVQT